MYIGLDCETGGLGDDVSLLEVFFGIYDEKLNLQDELLLYLKPDDGLYKIQAQALEINKINLVEHDKYAHPYKDAKSVLYNFLSKHSQNGKVKLVPIGHNVNGDIRWVCNHIISRNSWEYHCSYRLLDTGVIGQFMKLSGLLPESVSGGLGTLAEYYGLSFTGEQHTAKADVDMTVRVLRQMRNTIQWGEYQDI